ncbi:hypothetical protein BROC_00003 [Candidatus Brocadiaceae bacterium]|nr:hypothetical protein BROC_00003 [Candidatus Brocadiaceae bacterium]
MKNVSLIYAFTAVLVSASPSLAETLAQKYKGPHGLSTYEMTAALMAGIRDCEIRSPGFKDKARPYLARVYANKNYQKITNSKEYKNPQLAMDADVFISEQRTGQNINDICKQTLGGLPGFENEFNRVELK